MAITCKFVDGIDGASVLDLNDQTSFYTLDDTLFPLPEAVYNWVENATKHGRRLANWHLGGNTITLKLAVEGSDEQDAYDTLNVLLAQLLTEGTLEVRLWGADVSVFYHTYPATPKLPDMVREKYVIDRGFIVGVTVEIPVDYEVKLGAVTLTVLEALGVNDSFEYDAFTTWTETQPVGDANDDWRCCASDDDGTNLIAGDYGGRLWISTDSGATWTETRPDGDRDAAWVCVASDADGTNLIVGETDGRLWTSANSGATWTERQPGGNVDLTWYCCASDSDGTNLIAGVAIGRLYTSDDSGATWDERQPAGAVDETWSCCASDSDGTNLIAGAFLGRLWTSANSGVAWTERQPAGAADKAWSCCASDADGSNLIAGVSFGRLWTSANSGVAWTERQPAGAADKNWYCCASDDDGTNLIVGVSSGRLYTSGDSGATWTEEKPAGDANKGWSCCASDADGSALLVGVYDGRLYIGDVVATTWTKTETDAGTVTIDDDQVLDGLLSCELETTAGGTDVAAITDSDYIVVDADKHYQLQVYAYEDSGAANLEVDVKCYSVANALLGTLELVEDYNPTTSDKWLDACEVGGTGVINPVGGDAPAFPTGTVKVKRVIRNNAAAASLLMVDRLWFGCTEYIPGYKLSGAVGIVIPPEDIEGILPAKADIRFDAVYDRFTDLVLAQRDAYSADFDPVQEPSGATEVLLYTRRSQNYYTLAGLVNLAVNPDFETITGGSGNTTDWQDWTETRSAYTNHVLQTQTGYYHAGTKAVQVGVSNDPGRCDERLLSAAYIAVDPGDTYFASMWARRSIRGELLRSNFVVYFYDVGNVQLGYKVIWSGYPGTSWERIVGYVYPDDMPVGTTQAKIRLRCWGTVKSGAGTRYAYHYWDDMMFGVLDSDYIEAVYPIDAHYGRAFVTGGFSFDASDAYDELTAQTFVKTVADQEITPHVALETVDIGDANTDFQEVFLHGRLKISLPSHTVSDAADLSYLEQVVRVAPDPSNAADLWYDHIALLYHDRAITEVTNWENADCMILDSRWGRTVMVSLDGTLNTATVFDHQNWKSPPAFEADPEGVNMTLLAVKESDGDYQLTPVVDMTITYNPTYLLTASS